MARRNFLILLACFLILWAFFLIFPQIDLWVSGLFYRDGVWLGTTQPYAFLREVYYKGSIIAGIYVVIMALIVIHKETVLSKLFYQFFAWLVILGPTLLVNRGFKEFFGRARPYKVEEFGGDLSFHSVPISPLDQCHSNCSFISGEASGAMTLILVGLALSAGNRRQQVLVWMIFLPMAIMRIMAGKHFISDVIMAMVFVAMLYWLMLWLIKKTPKDLWGTWQGFGADFLGLFRRKN